VEAEVNNEQMNRVAAEACGWTEIGKYPSPRSSMGYALPPGKEADYLNYRDVPDFCKDRNALPQLWKKVEDANKIDDFLRYLLCTNNPLYKDWPVPHCNPSYVIDWLLATAPPKHHVIAFLRALGLWTGGEE
jgi:hypothetical protein